MTPPIMVLHEIGDGGGGAPWREALAEWPGAVAAPDLPGHGVAAPPVDGNYTNTMVLLSAVDALPAPEESAPGESAPAESAPGESVLEESVLAGRPVVVGVGTSGWTATVVALAGAARALVLVDGMGGPWLDAADAVGAGVDWLRTVAADEAAVAPIPPDGPDPRLAHGLLGVTSRATVEAALTALKVPLLVLSSPSDPLSAAERDDVLQAAAAGATAGSVPDRAAASVAAPLLAWAAATRH